MHPLLRHLVIILFLTPSLLYAGNGDTATFFKSKGITHYFSSGGFESADSSLSIDNSLAGYQNYCDRNNLGNIGLPIADLVYNPSQISTGIGFNYWKNNYQNYFYTPQNIKYYNTRSPFTDLFYVAGSKKESVFRLIFSYNIKKNWNTTVNFSRIRSEGLYKQTKTLDNFLAISSNFKSNNNRYWLLTSILFNGCKNAENGGIKADSDFVNGTSFDRKLIAISLSSAKRSVISKGATVKQFINFGSKTKINDSLSSIVPSSHLSLTTSFIDEALMYQDDAPADGFYRNSYYPSDTLKTFDSTYTFKFANELEWKRVDNGIHRGLIDMFGISLGVKDEICKIKQREIDTTFNNILLSTSLYNTYSTNNFWWQLAGMYDAVGYNKGDYQTSIVLKKKLIDSALILTVAGNLQVNAPDFIYNRYLSNHFKWNNNYDKTQTLQVCGDIEWKKYKLKLGGDYKVFKNILYFDNDAIARQYIGQVPLFTAYLKKDFKLLNWHLNNSVIYQYVPDSMVIRVPRLVLNHSLYYENDLLKGVLHLQIGASLSYSSAYFADAYMPATGEFYLQSAQKYGNYPFIDVFLNAKIKSVRVFIKVDHVNSGLIGNNYMITPRYAMNDRLFKIGINWRFWD